MKKRKPPIHADEPTLFRGKIEAVLQRFQDDAFLTDRSNREALYHLLKQVRDWSIVFGRKDVYGFTLLLLRQFLTDDTEYTVVAGNATIIRSLLEGLLRAMRGVVTANPEVAATVEASVSSVSTRTKVIVLGEGWFDFEAVFGDLPHYVPTTIPTEDMESSVSREILSEREFVLIVNLAPEAQGEQAVRELKASEWAKEVLVIGIVPGTDTRLWNERAASDVDLVLADPFAPHQLDAAIRQLLARKRKVSTMSRDVERQEMIKLLQKEWLRFVRFETHFSLVYIMLDQFTHLVQSLGSKEVLAFYENMYALCKRTIRNYDEIKRWKANAFVIMLPMSKSAGALMAVERILGMMGNTAKAEHFLSFVKIGVLESEHGYTSAEELLVRLEEQLAVAPPNARVYQIPPLQDESKRKGNRIKLLIVDDDLAAPTIINNHLSADEWEVEICSDGAEALERAAAFRPDVILSETSISGMNGFAFCLNVRQVLSNKQTAFLFLSKQGTSSNILRGLQVGADDYITKPFSVAVLEAKMRRLVRLRS
ncbi:MAG TPA: response regulator [Candidatus Bathyarchaeia archaeon]|nr:response regulator [Candidatus Bathyarchaeia archaeon]